MPGERPPLVNLDPRNQFRSDGRGPELVRLVWGLANAQLVGAEYRNPDDPALMHVRFLKSQAVRITPDEVVGDEDPDGVTDLGVIPWQAELDPFHLENCTHVRARFYDEAVDVICEGVEIDAGELRVDTKDAEGSGAP